MRYSDIQGLTPAQIANKFALPYKPTHYCYVDVPPGTLMYSGKVGPNFGYNTNLGIQFELGEIIDGNAFSTGIPLP